MRIATSADAPSIIDVTNVAFAIETFIEGTRTDRDDLAAMMQRGDFLVTEDASGQIVASVYIELRGTRGYIGMLAVHPSQQGRGLGMAMVHAGEDHCRKQGCQAVDISVLSLRPDLLPFYHSLGYTETSTEEFHPSRPLKAGTVCHCIIMSKKL